MSSGCFALPGLVSGHGNLDLAFQIAMGDLCGNIVPFRAGILKDDKPCLMAGLDYRGPWTRDAAINTWNACGLLFPEVMRSTLLSEIENRDGRLMVRGQYWDAIIWVVGAWHQYLCEGNRKFLATAFEVTRNALEHYERTEYDPTTGLFRGPAVYGDGIAAYPDRYAVTDKGSACILDWPAANPASRASVGYGIPMQVLSTNCIYAEAYRLAVLMASELRRAAAPTWLRKHAALKRAINRQLWDDAAGQYRYFIDHECACDHREGLGHSFAVLLGIADRRRAARVLDAQPTTAAGIPCVWPTFDRYRGADGRGVGRHSGAVWPHVQGFWAEAAARNGRADIFWNEASKLAEHAVRDVQFTEIYHPETRLPYGGLQEDRAKGIREWASCRRQSWSASAFVRMVLMGLLGASFSPEGVSFAPVLPAALDTCAVHGLVYRGMKVDIEVRGSGRRVSRCTVNGRTARPFLPAQGRGRMVVRVEVR